MRRYMVPHIRLSQCCRPKKILWTAARNLQPFNSSTASSCHFHLVDILSPAISSKVLQSATQQADHTATHITPTDSEPRRQNAGLYAGLSATEAPPGSVSNACAHQLLGLPA